MPARQADVVDGELARRARDVAEPRARVAAGEDALAVLGALDGDVLGVVGVARALAQVAARQVGVARVQAAAYAEEGRERACVRLRERRQEGWEARRTVRRDSGRRLGSEIHWISSGCVAQTTGSAGPTWSRSCSRLMTSCQKGEWAASSCEVRERQEPEGGSAVSAGAGTQPRRDARSPSRGCRGRPGRARGRR